MGNIFGTTWKKIYIENIFNFFAELGQNPFKIFSTIIDLVIVLFLFYCFFKMVRGSRAWQLIKGIIFLIIATWISSLLNLNILNSILTGIMNWGVMAILIIFQPELRRALEQLGTNKFTKFFGIDSDIATKTKEDIYKVVIATTELAKTKTGALIVMERDINIQDVIATGIPMNSEVSPQLLVNIFVPKTPLHDGAVVISNNKIAASACVLPLADDVDISKDGVLITDITEDSLKKILISNIVTKRFTDKEAIKKERFNSLKHRLKSDKNKKKQEKEDNEEK